MSKTKDRILDTALLLFNENGSQAMTTNHIAKACEMSPGNLYYHFKNREQIIVALFERMISEWDESPAQMKPSLELLDQQLDRTFHFVWQYRFVHRELAMLVAKDPLLKELCSEVLSRRVVEISQLIRRFEEMGVVRKLKQEERAFIANTALFYGLFWQPYLEVLGEKPTEEKVRQGVAMIKLLLQPYLIS